jgi:hypothetical protein
MSVPSLGVSSLTGPPCTDGGPVFIVSGRDIGIRGTLSRSRNDTKRRQQAASEEKRPRLITDDCSQPANDLCPVLPIMRLAPWAHVQPASGGRATLFARRRNCIMTRTKAILVVASLLAAASCAMAGPLRHRAAPAQGAAGRHAMTGAHARASAPYRDDFRPFSGAEERWFDQGKGNIW